LSGKSTVALLTVTLCALSTYLIWNLD